jgi:hypothetical protein
MEQAALDNNDKKRLRTVEEIVGNMEKKITKIFEVVVGDESFGQVGIIQRLVTVEKKTDSLETFKNKLVGASVVGGAFVSLLIEIVKFVFKK